MPITIVSSLAKSPPAQAEASVSAENADAAQGFASLLLGQLAAAIPSGETVAGTALEAVVDLATGGEKDDEASAQTDPLALLAAMSQAPVENRRGAVPPVSQQTADDTPLASVSAAHATDVFSPDTGTLVGRSEQRIVDSTNASNGRSAPQAEAPDTAPAANDLHTQPPSGAAAKIAAAPAAPLTVEPAPTNAEAPEIRVVANEAPPPALAPHPANVYAHNDARETLSVSTPLRDPTWNNDFAQKVVWIATGQKQAAELTLNPPSMGSIEISLRIDSEKSTANATFVSTNAEVRETIETALPRLREMLAGAGIQLGQANVSAESFRQASGNEGGTSPSRNDKAILGPDLQTSRTAGSGITLVARGLVDTFA